MKGNISRRELLALTVSGLGVGNISYKKLKNDDFITKKSIISTGFNAFDWSSLPDGLFSVKPVVGEEYVFAVTDKCNLYQFSIETGESNQIGSVEGSTPKALAKQGNRLFVATESGPLTAYNYQSGTTEWTNSAAKAGARAEFTSESIIIPLVGFSLLAVETQTGQSKWEYEAFSEFLTTLTTGGQVYASQANGNIVSIDVKTGENSWTTPVDGTPVGEIINQTNKIVVGTSSGNLVSINKSTGEIVSRFNITQRVKDQLIDVASLSNSVIIGALSNRTVIEFDTDTNTIQWDTTLDGSIDSIHTRRESKVVAQLTEGDLVAIDPDSGSVDSQLNIKNGPFVDPVIGQRSLYGGMGSRGIFKLIQRPNIPRNWVQTFNKKLIGVVHPSNQSDRMVVTGSDDVGEFSILSGENIWKKSFATDITTKAAVLDDRLITFREGGIIEAIDREKGEKIWREQVGISPSGPPTVAEDSVYIPLSSGGVEKWDANTGSQTWNVLVGSSRTTTEIEVGERFVYGGNSSSIFSIDTTNTQDVVRQEIEGGVSTLLVDDEAVYYGSESSAVGKYSLRSGEPNNQDWVTELDGPVSSKLVISDQQLYAGTRNGMIYSLDAETGSVNWEYPTANTISGTPVVSDQKIFVPSEDGQVYVLRVRDGAPLAGSNISTPADLSVSSTPEGIITGSSSGKIVNLKQSFKTQTETPTASPTFTRTPTQTQSPTPTRTPSKTETKVSTQTPSSTPLEGPTSSPTPSPSVSSSDSDSPSASTSSTDSTVTVVPGLGVVTGTVSTLLASKGLLSVAKNRNDSDEEES